MTTATEVEEPAPRSLSDRTPIPLGWMIGACSGIIGVFSALALFLWEVRSHIDEKIGGTDAKIVAVGKDLSDVSGNFESFRQETRGEFKAMGIQISALSEKVDMVSKSNDEGFNRSEQALKDHENRPHQHAATVKDVERLEAADAMILEAISALRSEIAQLRKP